MGVRLNCDDCEQVSTSALFYRGANGEHNCNVCGGHRSLVDPTQDRRKGIDRRQRDDRAATEADWRSGVDRRQPLP